MTLAHERPAQLRAGTVRDRPAPLRELLLIGALWLSYTLGRLVADGHVEAAYENAGRVWHLERLLRLPAETDVQHLLLRAGDLVEVANSYYAYVHFPATIGFLLWVYLCRPAQYRVVRSTLALLTGAALVVHLIFPLAPPRMLADTGLVDTGHLYGPAVYGTPGGDDLTNQYAAMPSLHVGWALLVAITLITLTAGRRRWLWLAHPLLTLLVVVGTANHYWLDAIVAAALLAVALRLTGLHARAVTAGPAATPPARRRPWRSPTRG
ncbi:MAG: phosphatase PAP2 family protein [Actinoplanes sp.]